MQGALPPSATFGLFMAATNVNGIDVHLLSGTALQLSPAVAGFFTAMFWTSLPLLRRYTGTPSREVAVLYGYAVAMTLATEIFARFHYHEFSDFNRGLTYLTALFAGTGIALYMAAPVATFLASPHDVPRAPALALTIGIPVLLGPLAFFAHLPLVGTLLFISTLAGFWIALLLINVGLVSLTRFSPGTTFLTAALLVPPQYFLISVAYSMIAISRMSSAPFRWAL